MPQSSGWSVPINLRALGIPEGVRQVIERRISRLSAATGDMLRYAAGFVRSFAFDVLQAVTGLPEDALLDCLDEALQAGLIHPNAETPIRYDFTHIVWQGITRPHTGCSAP